MKSLKTSGYFYIPMKIHNQIIRPIFELVMIPIADPSDRSLLTLHTKIIGDSFYKSIPESILYCDFPDKEDYEIKEWLNNNIDLFIKKCKLINKLILAKQNILSNPYYSQYVETIINDCIYYHKGLPLSDIENLNKISNIDLKDIEFRI